MIELLELNLFGGPNSHKQEWGKNYVISTSLTLPTLVGPHKNLMK